MLSYKSYMYNAVLAIRLGNRQLPTQMPTHKTFTSAKKLPTCFSVNVLVVIQNHLLNLLPLSTRVYSFKSLRKRKSIYSLAQHEW